MLGASLCAVRSSILADIVHPAIILTISSGERRCVLQLEDSLSRRLARRVEISERKAHGDSSARTVFARDGHFTTIQSHDLVHDVEADAHPT